MGDHQLRTYTSLAQLGITPGSETVEGIATALGDGGSIEYSVDSSYNSSIYPSYGASGGRLGIVRVVRLTVSRVSFEFALKADNYYSPQKWLGFYSRDAGWHGWVLQATATPPTWYEPTLQNGFQKGAVLRYGKDGGGTIFFTGVFSRSTQPLSNEQITQLPAGYRPDRITPFTITSGRGWCTYGYIETNGVVKFSAAAMSGYASDDGLAFNVSFPCAA